MFCYTSKLKDWAELICLTPAGTTNLPSFYICKVYDLIICEYICKVHDLIICEWKAQVNVSQGN